MMCLHCERNRRQIRPFTQRMGCTDNRVLNAATIGALVRYRARVLRVWHSSRDAITAADVEG
jgi:hypothetical protein